MDESNIFFATNTYNYGKPYTGPATNKFNESKGDVEFFKQVMDYDALKRFRSSPQMGGNFNTSYYLASYSQIKVLDPNFSVMIGKREKDPIIELENRKYDEEYGYPEKNNYYPLIEEIIVDNDELSYADEILGKWIQNYQQETPNGDDLFGLYIKQKIKIDKSIDSISPREAGFEEIEDRDPYYYNYEEDAGRAKHTLGSTEKAKLFEEKYGSIFRAFKNVEQEEIIKAPHNQWTFVNAGPGTGKTYTLLKKITYMVENYNVDPEEIVVLCFTNAAVNEIKARIKKYAEEEGNRSFINVDVRTFHSFSWLLIGQANEAFVDRPNYKYIDYKQLSYNKSITEATKIIQKFGDEVFGGCKHLIVDEIQDLTNERASLVMSIVQECMKNHVGITVLGDSCQAIYDYSDEDTSFVLKSDRFYKYMFSEFYENGEFYKLEKNHRQTEALKRIAEPLRASILEGKKESIHNSIIKANNYIDCLTKGPLSVKLPIGDLKRITETGSVCLMCRSNAQVLATSTNLNKRGISHIVNAYDEFEYLSGWIGKMFSLYTKEIIEYEDFKTLYSQDNSINEAEEVWLRLQEIIGSKNNVLKVSEILRVANQSKVDDPIFRNVPRGNLIVSNIHKSKGREYDTVIVEQKFINRLIHESKSIKSVPEYIEEAKTMYVAITRPRCRLYFNSLATTNVDLKKIKTGRKRLARGDGSNLVTIEVRAFNDAKISSYNNADIQEYIINNVSVGDEIKLLINTRSQSISYYIVHTSEKGERIIGIVSNEFLDDVDAIISPHNSPWPKRITDLYVSGIHTKISNDYSYSWCWVDFCGLGAAHSDAY